jgi:hypothetical protein
MGIECSGNAAADVSSEVFTQCKGKARRQCVEVNHVAIDRRICQPQVELQRFSLLSYLSPFIMSQPYPSRQQR